jgi:hypothetical protein
LGVFFPNALLAEAFTVENVQKILSKEKLEKFDLFLPIIYLPSYPNCQILSEPQMMTKTLSHGPEQALQQAKIHIPDILQQSIEAVYIPAGFMIEAVTPEDESKEYGAHRLGLNGEEVVFRVAKTTPTKIGQFVTLWKRPKPDQKPSAPGNKPAALHIDDGIRFVVIHVHDGGINSGQFVFPSSILLEKGIMANDLKKGKTAFRIYPPWTKPIAPDAIKTQTWQAPYFFSIDSSGYGDYKKVQTLFKKEG